MDHQHRNGKYDFFASVSVNSTVDICIGIQYVQYQYNHKQK